MNKLSKIESALVELLRERNKVFYASLLLQMVRVEDPNVHTIGVAVDKGRILLIISPKFVETVTLNELTAIMEHECLHLVFEHPLRCGDKILLLWNLAADIAINQMIEGLPKWACLPKNFKLPEGKHAELYYELLKRDVKEYKITLTPVGCPKDAPRPCPESNKGAGGNVEEQKDCQNEKCPHAGTGNCPLTKGEYQITVETSDGKKSVLDNHGKWKDIGRGVDRELKKEIIKQAIKQAYEETQKNRGCLPGGVEEAIKEWLRPPTIGWKQLLRQFVSHNVKAGTKFTWKRTSRRFGEGQKGTIPVRTLKAVIAIDTSGSVETREFNEFMGEMKGIMACYRNETTVIECDAAVQKVYQLKPYTKINPRFKGRGGTDYEPVFEYIRQNGLRPDLLIYFTDMYCSYPKKAPPYNVLWVCSSRGNISNMPPWGATVQIKERGAIDES